MAGLFDDVPDAKKLPASGLFDDIPSNSVQQGSWTDNIRDPAAGILKIGPTALKGVADIARLLTGDRIGVDTSNAMQRGMQSIDDIVGSERLRAQKAAVNEALQDPNVSIGQLPGVVMDNPRAALDATISTVGSMFLPAGAAAGAVKALPSVARVLPGAAAITPGAAATGATVVTGAAQNAAETFADTQGRDLADRYKGAGISGATSLVLGRLLGGGAEGVVARRLAGEAGARGALALGRSAVTTGAKEFGQEFGEESANYVGKQVAKDEAIDPNTMGKQGLYGGMIGFGMGGASDVATNVGNIGRAGIERQVADAIEQAAQEYADQNAPRVVQQTVARIFDDLPQQAKPQATPEAAPETAPGPLALPFDPNVRNPQAAMVVDAAGNVRPLDADEQLTQQQRAERMTAMGLTPDVQRAINQRQQSPEPQPAAVPSDLIQRLLGAGWTPPAAAPETANSAPIEQTQPEQAQAAADRREAPRVANVSLMNEGKTPQRLGVGNVPMADGAKPFKTKLAAQKAKKLQPTMRVVKVEGGYALADKTPAQLAAAEKAAKRLRTFSAGTAGKPMAAHEFIVGKGGMSAAARSELGIEGNPRVGNRTLYGRQGLTLAQAAELLKEAGYITDETENSASDIIRRSMSDPQYTPEGWGQVAEREREAQFEDHLAAQQEAAQADDFDPFDPLSDAGFMEDDSDGTGFWEADPALQAEVSALAAQLEVLGVDTYDVLDPIIRANTQATQDQYNELAKQALTEAIAQATQPAGNRDSGQNDGEQGQARGQTEAQPDEGLTAYTPEEVTRRLEKLEQAEAERKAAEAWADREDAQARERAEVARRSEAAADTFELGQDPMDNLTGQGDIFSAPAEPGPAALTYTTASKIDSPAQSVLANAKERKARAFARLKAVRQQVKDGTANRLDLLKAESAHRDAVREVEAAEAQLERDANRLGLTTVREDGGAYNVEVPRRSYTNDRQLQLFLDSGPVESQAGPRGEAAQRAAVAAVDDLRSTETILGLALSRDYAARQRVSLVGQKVSSAEDLAVLAQVYRDPRFETFRVVFVNDSGRVVSQVGLTSRLPASAPGIMGDNIPAFLDPLMVTARNLGASGYYMLHNHPSGTAQTSRADESLTRAYVANTPYSAVAFRGHVVIDTNEYSVIDADGNSTLHKKDFGQPAPYQAQEWADVKIGGPADVMAMAKRLQVDEDAVTLIHTDNQYRVKAINTIPAAATEGPYAELRRLVTRATLKNQSSQLFAVSRSRRALSALGALVRNGIHVRSDGTVHAVSSEGGGGGQPFPNARRTRVSPDTSPEFAYLRRQSQPAPMLRVAEPSRGKNGAMPENQAPGPQGDAQQGADKGNAVADGFVRLYHGGNAGLSEIEGGTGPGNIFGGIFTSQSRASAASHGDGSLYYVDVHGSKVLSQNTLDGLDQNEVANALRKAMPWLDDADFDIAYEAVVEDRADRVDGEDLIRVFREDSEGEASLEAQRIRGELAKNLGFQAIEMNDEHGTSYLVLPGVKVKPANDQSAPDTDGASIVREEAPSYDPRSLQGSTETWTVPEPGTFDNAVRAIQNNKIDLKRVRDSIQARYGKLSEQADAYLNEELYHGKVAARIETLHKEYVEPILAKIAVAGKNVGVTMDDVNLYLHARHAPERNAAMKAINPDMKDNEALSGMSNQQAAKVMADFTAAGKDKALALIARDVDQLLADTRTGLVADGLEDAGVIAAWEAAYKHYVPLQRDIGSSGTPKGMGFSVRGPEAKRAVGSNKEVVNILANIVTQAETAAIRAEKATVGRSLLAMARQYPNPDFWKVDIAPTKPRIDKDTGLVQRNAVDPLYQTADNVIMVKDYGQEHFIVFNQKNDRAMAVAKAMRNLDIAPMNKILEVANKGTRFLASLLTQRNPLFWLTNFSRDIQGAMLNLEGTEAEGLQREVMGNLGNAFKGMHALVRGEGRGQWARYAQELKDAGGTTGYMQAFENSDARMADITKEVERMQQGKADPRRLARLTLEFIDDYNDIIENAVRLSVFQAARDAGVSSARAASIAKNITVNFNRKGNLTPPINALYMFFNASVQGTARLVQAVATSKTARAAVAGIAIMGFLLDALNRAMSDDDEETGRNRYDLIPEFDKSKNWIIMNPMRPGEYVKIPLPLGPHVFHNAGRLLSDATFREDPRNAAEYGWSLAGTLIDAFNPLGTTPSLGQMIAPSVLDPALQVTENKSFTGAPVYKSADRGFGNTDPKPAYTRYFESTPDVWKGASRMLNNMTGGDKDKPGAINVEPDILKHVFYTMTGGPGRTLDQAIDMTQAGARGKDLTVNRVPLASRFYGANDDQQRERAYYDDRKRILDAKTTFDYYAKLGRQDEARKIAEELGGGDATKGRKLMLEFSRAEKSVRKLNTEIRRELEREGDDDGDAKAEQLKALRQRRMRVMSDAVSEDE